MHAVTWRSLYVIRRVGGFHSHHTSGRESCPWRKSDESEVGITYKKVGVWEVQYSSRIDRGFASGLVSSKVMTDGPCRSAAERSGRGKNMIEGEAAGWAAVERGNRPACLLGCCCADA